MLKIKVCVMLYIIYAQFKTQPIGNVRGQGWEDQGLYVHTVYYEILSD